MYKEHRGAWLKPRDVPDSNIEGVGSGAAWLPCYPPDDFAVMDRQNRAGEILEATREAAAANANNKGSLEPQVRKTDHMTENFENKARGKIGSCGARIPIFSSFHAPASWCF